MTSPESQAKSIFLNALEIVAGPERQSYLEEACQGDAALRREIDALLQHRGQVGSFLESPVLERVTTTAEPSAERPGTVIGPYKLLQQIGEGGMGIVFMAEQTQPILRKVALKVIKPGMDSCQVIARFEAERQALALMDHVNIARVLDAGTTEAGRPYFVMELVHGVPITRYCDDNRLTPRERLELFVPVCRAIEHAHQKGIIHRDLKPSNVMVTLYDGKAVPKVIDFGVAKATEQKLTERTLFTQYGTMVGTLEYMSPEQAEMSALGVDTRSDIYSLGVLLYELLTGSTPLCKERMKEAAYAEILRMIKEEEPPKPSTRLSESGEALASISAQRKTEPAKLSNLMRGELDWIVMKTLEKDRNRRYETASGFAADVQHYLNDEAVQACPPSAGYRMRKFVRRNKGPVLAAALVSMALVMGMGGTTFGLIRAEHRRVEAERAQAEEATQRQIAGQKEQEAIAATNKAVEALRATTDEVVGKLLGQKSTFGPIEKEFLESTLKRWQTFADEQGSGEQARKLRAEGLHRVAYFRMRLGANNEAFADLSDSLAIWQQLVDEFPSVPSYHLHLAQCHGDLGWLLSRRYEWAKAEEQHRHSLAIWQQLTEKFPAVPTYRKGLADSHHKLATVLTDLNQWAQAVEQYRHSLAILRSLAEEFPAVPEYRSGLASNHNDLGILLKRRQEIAEAESQYRQAQVIFQKLAEDFPAVPSYLDLQARNDICLGKLLADRNQWAKAEEQYRHSLAICQKLAAEFPAMPECRANLAESHDSLGITLSHLKERVKAEQHFRQALAIWQKLSDDIPDVPKYRERLANAHHNVGLSHVGGQEEAKAEEQFSLALAIYQKLADDFPAVPKYRSNLAHSHDFLGILLTHREEWAKAEEQLSLALAINQKLADEFPSEPNYQVSLGGTCCNLAGVCRRQGKPEESLVWVDRAIAVLRPVHERAPGTAQAKLFLLNSHSARAKTHDALGKHAEALKDWDRCFELCPKAELPIWRAKRADSQLRAGMAAEAVADVADLTKTSNWTSDQWYDFARIYAVAGTMIAEKKQEYADRAMELLTSAVKAGYKNAAHMAKDADLDALRDRGDFKKLMEEVATKPAPMQ